MSVALPPVIVIALIASKGSGASRENMDRCVSDSARCVWRCLSEPREHAQSDAKNDLRLARLLVSYCASSNVREGL